ncbi:MAG: hypothetical protein U9R66_02025 [Thermodesulfobacteriota bacterium]|nr:hypothetical protein [Thermodesulfobacteriota bacterium]
MAAESDSKKSLDFELPPELDDDLDDDWESAFEAEDFMFSGEDDSDDFFLTDNESKELFDAASLLEEEAAQKKEAGTEKRDEADKNDNNTETLVIPATASSRTIPFSVVIREKLQTAWHRFSLLKPYQKILAAFLPVLFVLIVSGALFLKPGEETDKKQVQIQSSGAVDNGKTTPATPQQPATTIEEVKNAGESAPVAPPEPPVSPRLIRKKWSFPSFFIQAPRQENQETIFVSIDLTLILLLKEDQELPEEKKTFVRNMIYQFYINRPAYELRHFSLARGEMIRKLKSWIKKEWPDTPVDTIVFHRYQIYNPKVGALGPVKK